LLINPNKKILQDVYELKRNFIYIRKSLWSIRNMLNNVSLGDEIIDDKSIYYIKSVYNDVIQIIDLVETYREVCSGMLDTYLSSIGNKTNDVMKILTIVSTIFIPISFYSNLFMMNMKNIYSYVIFWGLSISTALCLLLYFKRKDWF
ncbi:MAG TPA: CorA family divalent cation transporter, partial [Tissierellaceae bacterium]